MARRRSWAAGYTLIELVTVLVLLAILSGVAIPRVMSMWDEGRRGATLKEMMVLRQAIVGDTEKVAGGQRVDGGYEGDLGSPPPNLEALVTNPGLPAWDRFARRGWNGPYIDPAGGGYATDAWGTAYLYDPDARTITSSAGGGTPLVVTF